MGSYDFGALAKAAPKAFEPIPVGTYNVEVIATEAKTYNSGNQGVNVDVAVVDEGQYKGRKIRFNTIVFNPENPSTFFSNLLGLGIGPEWFSEVVIDTEDAGALTELLEELAEELIDKVASTKVTQDKYEGRVNNKCGFFNKPTAAAAGGRRRRSTPDVDAPAPAPAQESAPAPEAEAEGEAPKRTRTGRTRRGAGGEPGLPPGL